MIYLASYLAIGIVALAAVVAVDRWDKRNDTPVPDYLLDVAYPNRHTLRYRVLNNVVIPALTFMVFMAGWPLALGMKIRDRLARAPEVEPHQDREFSVEHTDLVRACTMAEIEHRERVVDPLSAVTDAPFGHLHAAWRRFIETAESEDAIWSFESRWNAGWGREEFRSGYVLVRGDVIGAYFLTARLRIDEESQKDAKPSDSIGS